MSGNYTFQTNHIWTDHSSGRHILTLKTSAAGALQSTIPIWVSLVGAATWILVSRTWYHLRYRYGRGRIEHSHFERQEQLLLRNSGGDLSSFRDVFDLWKAWRGHSRSPSPFLAFFTLGTFIFWAGWQVIAIVTFYIWQTKVPDVGLIQSSLCGYLVLNSSDHDFGFRSTGLSQTILAETWVSQCYTDTSTDLGACNLYPTTALNYTTTADEPCPFASSDLCISTNSTPFSISSGPVNSHMDLGINAPPHERVVYYKNTTCSPIHGSPFAEIINANETDEAGIYPPDTVLQRFFFGPVEGTNETFTFEYDTWAPEDGFGYQITSLTYTPGPHLSGYTNAWTPNTTFFNRDDADLSLFFLTQNHIGYQSPSYDPFYLATEPYSQTVGDQVLTYYVPTYDVNVLSCIDQHRICDPTKDESTGCTAHMGWLQLSEAIFEMGLNRAQVAAAERIVSNLIMVNTFNSVNGRNAAALLASQTVSELLQIDDLPMNQWQHEVQNWFLVSLAKLQRSIIDYAGGPSDPSLVGYAHPQTNFPPLEHMCRTQRVKLPSAGYVNFNFDAIIGILVAGVFLALLNFFYEDIFDYALKRGNRNGRLQWIYDGPYQLQRLAYNARGVGGWIDEDEDLPLTSATLPPLINHQAPLLPTSSSMTTAHPNPPPTTTTAGSNLNASPSSSSGGGGGVSSQTSSPTTHPSITSPTAALPSQQPTVAPSPPPAATTTTAATQQPQSITSPSHNASGSQPATGSHPGGTTTP